MAGSASRKRVASVQGHKVHVQKGVHLVSYSADIISKFFMLLSLNLMLFSVKSDCTVECVYK